MKRTTATKDGWPRKITVGRVTVTVFRDVLPSGNSRYRVDNRRLTGRFDAYKSEEESIEAATRLASRIETGETKAAGLTEKQAMEYILSTDSLKAFGLTVGDASAWLTQALPKVGDIHKLTDALNFYMTNHRKVTNMTVAGVVDLLLERKKKKSERHYKTLKSRLGRFSKDFVCNIGDITTAQIQTWLDKQNFDSEQTYHNYWSNINQLFRYASNQEYVMNNAADKVERVDLESGEVGIYTPDEITKLLNASDKDFRPCLAIAAFAGLRSAEIERLEWSCVNWAEKEFFLSRKVTKTGYPRTVPIQDNLIVWLADYKDAKGKVWKGSHDAYYDTQQEVSGTSGVQWVHNGLRHSYGTYRFRVLNGDVTTVAAEMGNSKAMVENHYKRLVPANDATLYFGVTPERPGNVVSLAAEG